VTERVKQLLELVEAQAKKIEILEAKIDFLTQKLYGKSSEQLDKEQLQLELDGVKKEEAASEEVEVNDPELAAKQHPKRSNRPSA